MTCIFIFCPESLCSQSQHLVVLFGKSCPHTTAHFYLVLVYFAYKFSLLRSCLMWEGSFSPACCKFKTHGWRLQLQVASKRKGKSFSEALFWLHFADPTHGLPPPVPPSLRGFWSPDQLHFCGFLGRRLARLRLPKNTKRKRGQLLRVTLSAPIGIHCRAPTLDCTDSAYSVLCCCIGLLVLEISLSARPVFVGSALCFEKED